MDSRMPLHTFRDAWIRCSGTYLFVGATLMTSSSGHVEEHVQHLSMVFQRLREAGLKVHPGKCVFGADSIDFLGHRISADKLEPQQYKIAAVRDFPAPTYPSGLRAALGLFSYYRKFVPHFSTIAFPLNALMKKDRPWEWGKAQADAFGELKE